MTKIIAIAEVEQTRQNWEFKDLRVKQTEILPSG